MEATQCVSGGSWSGGALLETTTDTRPGKGRPMDSNVTRPITMTPPMVKALKWRNSWGMYHAIVLFFPNAPWLSTATTS